MSKLDFQTDDVKLKELKIQIKLLDKLSYDISVFFLILIKLEIYKSHFKLHLFLSFSSYFMLF